MLRWRAWLLCSLSALVLGSGLYTFIYAKGGSYLTNNPQACANCHIMNDHYNAWLKSSHRLVATCNDCHTPDSFFPKYKTKFLNGFHHSLAFTLGNFKEPLQIKTRNQKIVEVSCRHCHEKMIEEIEAHPKSALSCTRCHRSVGHPL